MKEMKNPVKDEKKNKRGYISDRIVRGGFWDNSPSTIRTSSHDGDEPGSREGVIGFRIVRNQM